MSSLICMVNLLTVFSFGCVDGASLTTETAVSNLAAWTSEDIHTQAHVLEMRKATRPQRETGGHQNSYKFIYQHHGTAIRRLNDDELNTYGKASSQVGLSNGVMLSNDLWKETKNSETNSNHVLLTNDMSDVKRSTEFRSNEHGEVDNSDTEQTFSEVALKFSTKTQLTETVDTSKNKKRSQPETVDFAKLIPAHHVESNSIEISHAEMKNIEFVDHLRVDRAEKSDTHHVEVHSMETADCVAMVDHAECDKIESAAHIGHEDNTSTERFTNELVQSLQRGTEGIESTVQVGAERVESADRSTESVASIHHVEGDDIGSRGPGGDDSVNFAEHVGDDSCASCDEAGPVVRVHGGFIRGLTLDKAHAFYGIPYADPPLGQWRWTPPQPLTPWLHTYNATFPRSACMQACAGEFAQMCPPKVSEDCLYLNVFVPRSVNLSLTPTALRPVLVWIHGGDFIAGSASRPLYDGRFISNYSNTLVVNIEYRLGAFGFLVTGKDPVLSATGNYGIMDQQAALLWIRDNIRVFAGDPNRVTLMGESAGAQSVALHLMIRSSEFLFSQATLQSLPFSIPLKTRWDAKRLGKDFARRANCSMTDMFCLRSLSSLNVLRAQVQSGTKIVNPFRFLEVFETWGPYIDDVLIEDQPISAFQKGYWQRDKPVIIGSTSEEGVIFVFGVFSKPVSVMESMAYTTAIFKQHTITVLHKYLPLHAYTDRRTMLSQIVTDFVFRCPSRYSARSGVSLGGSMWVYVFDQAISDHRMWKGITFCYGHVCHGAELPFIFGSATVANLTMKPAEELLANRMLCYWGAFAHTGDPNSRRHQSSFCRDQRLPIWPRYTIDNDWPVMNLTVPVHAQRGSRDHICDFWDNLDIYH